MVRVACAMARHGATDLEIAEELGISEKSFYTVCGRNPEFLQAVRAAKDVVDDRVERSLLHTAIGFTYASEKVFSNGFRAVVTERALPNPAAQMNWLANRRGWRRGDNVVQDAIDAVAPAAPGEAPNIRQLALASMALLAAAVHAPTGATVPNTIDVSPNQTSEHEETDYDPDDQDDPDFDIDA